MPMVPALFLSRSKVECHLNEVTEKKQSLPTLALRLGRVAPVPRLLQSPTQWRESQPQKILDQSLTHQGPKEEDEHESI